jgi:DNA-binding HxlR family transcriptional regulator
MTEKHFSSPQLRMCPKFEKAVTILGKRWTGLIISALMNGPLRFNELLKAVGVSDRVLTERLRELEVEGLVERMVYAEVAVRIEYRLTCKGHDMKAVVDAIQQWAENWVELDNPQSIEQETNPEVATPVAISN